MSILQSKSIKKDYEVVNNRRRGHDYERKIKNELNELIKGSDWRTTREMSRYLDNKKIDLIDVNGIGWFTVQCKTSINTPNFNENVFFFEGRPNILFWKKNQKRANSVRFRGKEFVIMRKEDFYNLIRRIVDDDGK